MQLILPLYFDTVPHNPGEKGQENIINPTAYSMYLVQAD